MFGADFPVVPERMALINVDMQNCFVDGYPVSAPDGLELQERINRLAAACRAAGIAVVHCSHVVRPDGSNIGVMGELIPPVREGMIDKGSRSAALHDGLAVEDGDILLDKPRFGAFHGTDLEMVLRGARHRHDRRHRHRDQRVLRDHGARGQCARLPGLLPLSTARRPSRWASLRRTRSRRRR